MSAPCHDPLYPVPVTTNPGEKYASRNREFQGIPAIERTPGGRLWAAWYAGGVGEGPDNYAVVVTSGDDGQTWSEPAAVVDPAGDVRAYDPALWVDPAGNLWLFWAQCLSREINNIFDGVAGVWASRALDPERADTGWSAPVRIGNGVMMNKPVALSSGAWLYPLGLWNDLCGGTVPPSLRHEKRSNVYASVDNGASFVLRGGADVPDRCFDEHMVVELSGGRLWMLVRTNYGIGQSFSSDGGNNWTPGENSGIPGPNSRFFLRRLRSGRLLLVNHRVDPAEPKKRENLCAVLSEDEGKTWRGGLLLDERHAVSYPDGTEDETGLIRIIYDRERYTEGEILTARFREEDILAGRIVSPDAALRQLVNRTGGLRHPKP